MDLSPGAVLLGKYRIDEVIGSGGMGHVVRASHLYLHQPVAIKVLLPEMAQSDSTKQRFLREAQATVKLRSEHSARVMDVGTTPDGVPFMVMEFLEGNDLNQILRHHGPQLPSIAADLMLQACEGIAEAHALGIIHRDIKPSNFFITRRPDGSMLLKLLDFGISKTPVDYGELTGTQTVIGTPSYMAPEQMKSGRSADPRSDIWSIGVVMYQLLSGRLPFSGESYADLVLKVGLEPPAPMTVPLPPGLGEVILRCLEKDPRARHQHVGELARMLAPYASDPIAAAQSAGRTMRILQQRGAQQMGLGMQASPLTAGGGLVTPVPISPAQLTPRSWPPTHGSSLSHGAGQVTLKPRANRGLVIAGVVTLCVLAGAGGYAASQLTKHEAAAPTEPHVNAPAPTLPRDPTAGATTTGPATSGAGAPVPSATDPSGAAASASGSTASGSTSSGSSASGSSGTTASDSSGTGPSITTTAGAAASGTTAAASATNGTSGTAVSGTTAAASATNGTSGAASATAPSGSSSSSGTASASATSGDRSSHTGANASAASTKTTTAGVVPTTAARTTTPATATAAQSGHSADNAPPQTWKPSTPRPTIVESGTTTATASKTSDDARPAAKASDTRTSKTTAGSTDSKPATAKPSSAEPGKSRSADKPTTKPSSKPSKPHTDDLFDSRH